MIDFPRDMLFSRLVPAFVLGGLLILTYMVLQPFLIPLAWAIILCFVTWPLYLRLNRLLRHRRGLSALLMTLIMSLIMIVPGVWLALLINSEIKTVYNELGEVVQRGPYEIPAFIHDIPFLGNWLQDTINEITGDPAGFRLRAIQWLEQSGNELLGFLGGVGRNAAKLGFALVSLFFLYRDGDRVLTQVTTVLHRFLGQKVDGYMTAVGNMTIAVVWGLVATAIAQGIVAGIGYWIFDLKSPVLLGAITALIALVPFGTPFAWGFLSLWLLAKGDIFNGIGLAIWGTLLVSWVDNLVRPIVISNQARIPFLLVMFGVLGGLASFGFIGLFVGPVILAVVMAVWREWQENVVQEKIAGEQESSTTE